MKSISVSALAAEGLGTALLVIFGVGTAVITGDTVGTPGIALAFGLTLLALVYEIGMSHQPGRDDRSPDSSRHHPDQGCVLHRRPGRRCSRARGRPV